MVSWLAGELSSPPAMKILFLGQVASIISSARSRRLVRRPGLFGATRTLSVCPRLQTAHKAPTTGGLSHYVSRQVGQRPNAFFSRRRGTVTIHDWVRQASTRLAAEGVEASRLEAQVL